MDRPIRVVHVVDSMKLGGVQTLLCAVLPHLAERNIQSSVIVLHGPGPFSKAFSECGFAPTHLAPSQWDPRIPWKLRAALRIHAPDVVHAHGAPSCWLAERAHPEQLVEHLHHLRGTGAWSQRWMERRLYRRCDLVLACSGAVAESLATREKVRVVHNGIDPVRFRPPDAARREAARARFGFAPDEFVLGMTGRITANKGQRLACEALAACRDRYPKLRLLLAGSGPEEAGLRAWCAASGVADQVCFTGFLEDVVPALHALDAYVLASESEGFPMALLEAMGTGLPCLVSDFAAAREIVLDGENALAFQRGQVSHLVDVMVDCVESPHKRLDWGAAARDTITARFTIEQTVAKFAAVYESLCHAKREGKSCIG